MIYAQEGEISEPFKSEFGWHIIKVDKINVPGQIGKKLGMIQEKQPDIDLGSYPFYNKDGYGTNLVMRGTDMVALNAIFEEVHQMILSFGVEPIQE